MPRRSAFTADEARAYLISQNYPGAANLSNDYAKRLARGLQAGRSVSATRGHATTEHHYERARSVVFAQTQSAAVVTEFRMGRQPDTEETPEENARRSRSPQPADLIRLISGYTRSSLINVGIFGFLLKYMEETEEPPGYVMVHIWVQRDWFLARLRALPQSHIYRADDPAYLALAHDIVAADDSGRFEASNDTWRWGWIFQWTVRDRSE